VTGIGSKVTSIKFHGAAPQQFQILFTKGARPVMLGWCWM